MAIIPVAEENTTGELECISYCEDEDKVYRINIPVGTSCEEFFKKSPTCLCCGNTNLYAVTQNRPDVLDESKKD